MGRTGFKPVLRIVATGRDADPTLQSPPNLMTLVLWILNGRIVEVDLLRFAEQEAADIIQLLGRQLVLPLIFMEQKIGPSTTLNGLPESPRLLHYTGMIPVAPAEEEGAILQAVQRC